MSSLSFHVPRTLIFQAEQQKALFDLILLCHSRLTPFHGRAGFGAITTEQQIEWEPEELDMASRYRTLYAGAGFDALQAANGVKSVDWLTFIGNTLTQRLGSPDAFVAYCRRFGVEPISHGSGYFIRAGEYPQLGPVNEPPPEAYVRANAALRPLRNGNFGSMGTGSVSGEQRFNRCTSDLWIRRLDAPGVWPPATFVGLPRTPVGKAPIRKIKLKTGQTCVVDGRYRYPAPQVAAAGDDDDAPQLVLMAGDIAPYWLKLGPHGEYLSRDAVTWELIAEL